MLLPGQVVVKHHLHKTSVSSLMSSVDCIVLMPMNGACLFLNFVMKMWVAAQVIIEGHTCFLASQGLKYSTL